MSAGESRATVTIDLLQQRQWRGAGHLCLVATFFSKNQKISFCTFHLKCVFFSRELDKKLPQVEQFQNLVLFETGIVTLS